MAIILFPAPQGKPIRRHRPRGHGVTFRIPSTLCIAWEVGRRNTSRDLGWVRVPGMGGSEGHSGE
jgi:hypothetical protein